ncbi:transmembrane signal receptor [Lithospermum erythrorhizon]|uniref:Transmembrane signal receptor n=1 Tax=Lithospermum erythrorhizon TaxID=34254 RepID=A0AAV3RPR1_LITER
MSSSKSSRRLNSISRKSKSLKAASSHFLLNASALLAEFMAATNGKYDIPIRSFSADQLIKATNNFANVFHKARISFLCSGSFEGRQIIVKKFFDVNDFPSDSVYNTFSGSINSLVTTARMSKHKNVLRLLGCCLEFKYPVLVYEHPGTDHLLDLRLKPNNGRSLTWRQRLKIASDVANVIVYLHTAFDTPIIFRIINPTNVMIDQNGVAKLFDFSYSIALPPGKLQVEDDIIGVTGYIDPEYYRSGLVTQTVDVYSFGVLLLVLLTGNGATRKDEDGYQVHIVQYLSNFMANNQFKELVDQKIMEDIEGIEQEGKLQEFLDLALKCVQEEDKYSRPAMIEVAKELKQIEKFFR